MTTLIDNKKINNELMESFLGDMRVSGKSENTIKNYRIDIRNLYPVIPILSPVQAYSH